MTSIRSTSFLRRVLAADAATCVASGLLMTAGAGPVAELTGIPASLLWYAGLGLFPFAAFVAYVASRETVARLSVWAIIVCNALWVVDSIALLVSGWVEPTGLGIVFAVAQAAAVAAFAEAEYFGMRRAAPLSA